jgi:hypothetical protein
MAWHGVFFSLILARRWTGIIMVMASALVDLSGLRTGLLGLKALLTGSATGRLKCILLRMSRLDSKTCHNFFFQFLLLTKPAHEKAAQNSRSRLCASIALLSEPRSIGTRRPPLSDSASLVPPLRRPSPYLCWQSSKVASSRTISFPSRFLRAIVVHPVVPTSQ